jgi:hypothetical protein
VIVALLKVRQLQAGQFGTSQATAQQEGQDGLISFALRQASIGGSKEHASSAVSLNRPAMTDRRMISDRHLAPRSYREPRF